MMSGKWGDFVNGFHFFSQIRCQKCKKIATTLLVLFCICIFVVSSPSSIDAFSSAEPAPQGQDIYAFLPAPAPVYANTLSDSKPLGFGTAASGGSMFDLIVSIPSFLVPVDVYLAVTCDELAPGEIFLFTADNDLVALSTPKKDIRFKVGTFGNSYEQILKDIPVSLLAPYTWTFYLFITPADSFNSYVAWGSQLDLSQQGGGSETPSPGTGGGTAGTVAGSLLSELGGVSSGDFSNAVNILVSTIQEGSLDSVVTAIVTKHPEAASMISKTGDGYKVDFGAGHTFPSGTTVAGSMTVALTQHQSGQSTAVSSRQAVVGSFRFSLTNVKVNGNAIPDNAVNVGLQADVLGPGSMEGDIRLEGDAGSRGGVIFDSRKCSQFPLAGYLKVGNDIVNITPGCSGTYTAGGNDIPVLESITPSQIAKTNNVFDTTITIQGKNLWPPYIYDHEGGLDADYNYRCHLRIAGYESISDTYIDNWTADSITFHFPRASIPGTYEIYMECPWGNSSKIYYDEANKVTLTVK